jgi:hypothetical protein
MSMTSFRKDWVRLSLVRNIAKNGSVLVGMAAIAITAFAPPSNAQQRGKLIVNVVSGKCIDAKGAPGAVPGTKLQIHDCERNGRTSNGAASDQYWELTNGFLRNTLSGLCIDVPGQPGSKNGLDLQLANCEFNGRSPNGQPTDQKWFLRQDGAIVNQQSMKCIDVSGAPGIKNGSPVQLWDCESSGRTRNGAMTDQRWRF